MKTETSDNLIGLCLANTVDKVIQANQTEIVFNGFVNMCAVGHYNDKIQPSPVSVFHEL